ncbi:uncharacterized protein LOC122025584 isoform X1 [Zingiber officinale]|uniref:uncharacterized protein LOC122025584 isoform X1 n=1 Tax=Zingiber officinale TaxID=94328 RepID=UPI001C4B4760|nr:uncharacterized protein LOC122025584 isoform X1 [Zingiber officinale]XP_042440350.1 uncharacterized protein LOC122025584 isoform X1 [Zingiber officinale]
MSLKIERNVLLKEINKQKSELELHEARVMGIDGSSHIVIVSRKSPGIEREHVLDKVGWDESTFGERQPRVSLWEIEPLTTFPMYPSSFPLRLKRPWPSDLPSLHGGRDDLMWLQDGGRAIQSLNFQGFCNQTFTECYFKSWKYEWLKGKRTLGKI